MPSLLDLCSDQPRRRLDAGETLIEEGDAPQEMYVVVSGGFVVTRAGQTIASVAEPGAVFGEMSALLDTPASATVSAAAGGTAEVVVVADPVGFLTAEPAALLIVTRGLAARLGSSTAYLADLAGQYGSSGGNLGLIDEVLAKLAFAPPPAVEPGSEREPDPEY